MGTQQWCAKLDSPACKCMRKDIQSNILFYYHDVLVKIMVEYAVLDIQALNFSPVCCQFEFGSGL